MGRDAVTQLDLGDDSTTDASESTPRSVRCRACPKRLTDPVSIARGYGPCCARKRGLIQPSPRRSYIRGRAGGDVPGQGDLLAEEEG
ncbi:DUF6011 domain-containing protein [Streptosporangium sp. NPDC051023]|uniref:DUF6011 domain-containing protein n=1 Tax=Streptosporangium sp. NPDC051023 TaxID=3155410 RepID=UPI00344B19F1